MHKFRMLLVGACIALLAVPLCAEKTVFLTGEWDPYVSETLSAYGPSAEIVAAACKEAGIDYEFRFVPWKRCEAEAEAGQAYAAFPYVITEERKKTFDFSDSFQRSRGFIYWMSGGKEKAVAWNSLKDFAGYTFGGAAGYSYMEELTASGIKVETVKDSDALFKMMQAGRIDYLIEDELVAAGKIRKIFGADASKVTLLDKPFNDSPLGLLASRQYPGAAALTAKFNAGLAAIRKNGTYKAIMDKYGIKE